MAIQRSLPPRLAMLLAGLLPLAGVSQTNALGQQLRIETHVYSGNDAKPVSHTVTLFDSNKVYDFVDQPPQVAIFRPPNSLHAGHFVLLDLKTKQRTEISTEQIEGLMKKVTRWATQQDDPLLKFSAKPSFKKSFDEETGMLSLTSSIWNYNVATVPAEDATTLARYREFTDWYTRLNSMMHGAPPPGARLQLNAALQKHGVVPVEIHREVDSTTLRATHLFSWRLSREDRARIEEACAQLANFKKVGNEKFIASRMGKDLVRGQSR